jgi:hypothetical protein
MMKRLLILSAVILCGCAAQKPKAAIPIPTCGAQLVVPKSCTVRVWGNAIEVKCPDDPEGKSKIYHCDVIKESPK